MTLERFKEIFRCLDMDVDEAVQLVNETSQELWNCSVFISSDESMVAHQGRNNPHHLFIKGKPHPNGVKFYTAADSFKYLWKIILHKRTEDDKRPIDDPIMMRNGKPAWSRGDPAPKLPVPDIVGQMGADFPPGHHFVLDQYYGSVNGALALLELGHHATMSCRADRPSYLFSQNLSRKPLEEHGDYHAAYTKIQQGGEDMVVTAVTFKVGISVIEDRMQLNPKPLEINREEKERTTFQRDHIQRRR